MTGDPKMTTTTTELLTTTQVAALLGVTPPRVRQLKAAGVITPHTELPSVSLYTREAAQALLEMRNRATEDTATESLED